MTPKTSMSYEVRGETAPSGPAQIQTRRRTLEFDGSATSGEELPGPADLLCAALAACMLKNVERFSHMLPFRYERATIHVIAERQEPPPRIVRVRYELRIVTDESPDRVSLLHRNIRKFGTITNTLAAACDLDGAIVAVPTGGEEPPQPSST